MALEAGPLGFRSSQEVSDIRLRVIQEVEWTHRISDIGMRFFGLGGLPISPMADDASETLWGMPGQEPAGVSRQGLFLLEGRWVGNPRMACPTLLGAPRSLEGNLCPSRCVDREE